MNQYSTMPPSIVLFTNVLLRLCFAAYVCISVLFTTELLFLPLIRSVLHQSIQLDLGQGWTSTMLVPNLIHSTAFVISSVGSILGLWSRVGFGITRNSSMWLNSIGTPDEEHSLESNTSGILFEWLHSSKEIEWISRNPSFALTSNDMPRGLSRARTSTSLFLSKAFSVSQEYLSDGHKFEVVPYYYRHTGEHPRDDITITTLVTRNRFKVFKQLVEIYKGPISVTIHVPTSELQTEIKPRKKHKHGSTSTISPSNVPSQDFLSALHALYTSTPLMSQHVDVHLVVTPSSHDRQFNAWRNVARMFARTDYVMMLDVDFVPCTDFRERVRGASEEVKHLLREADAALVVPAFEYVKPEEGLDARKFPKSKAVI